MKTMLFGMASICNRAGLGNEHSSWLLARMTEVREFIGEVGIDRGRGWDIDVDMGNATETIMNVIRTRSPELFIPS